MATTSSFVTETTRDRFQNDVLVASQERPVVVDFWATWCEPCRLLTPVLEKLAAEFNGRFHLVKVNVEENQEIAGAFGVQSIPYVVAVRDGQPIDEFVGVLPEDKLREWIKGLLPSKAEELVKKGQQLEASDPKGALACYREAAELDPEVAPIQIALARILLGLNQDDECRKILDALETRGYLEPEAERLKSQLELRAAAAEVGPLDEARRAAAEAPENAELQLRLAEALTAANRHEEALALLLSIVQKDKAAVGGEAKTTMLRVFDSLGTGSQLVSDYRRKLATALY